MMAILEMNYSNFYLLYGSFWILIQISVMYIPKGPVDKNPVSVQILACRLISPKPLSESLMTQFTGTYMHYLASMS